LGGGGGRRPRGRGRPTGGGGPTGVGASSDRGSHLPGSGQRTRRGGRRGQLPRGGAGVLHAHQGRPAGGDRAGRGGRGGGRGAGHTGDRDRWGDPRAGAGASGRGRPRGGGDRCGERSGRSGRGCSGTVGGRGRAGMSTDTARVTVVGGGVIGLAIAWRCAQRGLAVTVYEAERPGAWQVAAGMLAPVSEAYFGEDQLTALLVASAQQWEELAAALAPYGEVGYRTEGSLLVALTADDLAEAERLWTYQQSLGLPVERLTAARVRRREPA